MILTRIEIENFKQYSGEHDLDVPAQATIGVIGENGTGKTSLFEAIEWCLYSPRSIRNEDVRPRGEGGTSIVRVFLESLDGAERYAIERVLKRTPNATIYRFDEHGDAEPIVNGTKPVSDYVASRLIGLSHAAFTATFFTRQKELHLFGDESPAKRREQIGRMLGLETIRAAHKAITSDRSAALAEARAMHVTYEREASGRDLPAELAAAEKTIASATLDHRQALEQIAQATVLVGKASEALARTQARRDRHTSLNTTIAQAEQDQRHRAARLEQIAADLDRLDREEQQRTELEPLATRFEALQQEHALQEANRQRFLVRQQAERELTDAQQRRRDANTTIRDLVLGIETSQEVPTAWIWTSDDNINLLAGIDRLLGVSRSSEPARRRQHEQDLRSSQELAGRLARTVEDLARYQRVQADLERQLETKLASSNPREQILRLDQARESSITERTRVHAELTAVESERDRTSQLIGNIRHRQFGDACPTCGRPFAADDAVLVIGSLEERVATLRQRVSQLNQMGAEVEARLTALGDQRAAALQELEEVTRLEQRLEKSIGVISNQQDKVDECRGDLQRLLDRLQMSQAATDQELALAVSGTTLAQALADTTKVLMSQRQMVEDIEERARLAEATVAEHREVSFDEGAFRTLAQSLRTSEQARTSIAHIDQQLGRRPALLGERESLTTAQAESSAQIDILQQEQTSLGYAAPELSQAQEALEVARKQERAALDASHRAEQDLQKAQFARESVVRDQQRLQDLARAGDERQREADRLALMVKELVEFERFAAARKLPVLADITSQLVSAVTDGKYDRVEFDQDFGIMVSDGGVTNETYGIDTFSGGERDAITLAARIALSHMIGRGATNPPGFLVLDEVFGSLDSDRRARLMDLLGSITSQFEELRQVFIISHVDDVRSSPVLDELWRVEETEDGSSRVTALSAGSEIESL